MESWVWFGILSAVAAALVAIFGKIGIAGIDSTLATTVRSVIMAVALLVTSLSLGKLSQFGTIGRRALLFIVLSGLTGAASWLFYFSALKNGPASGVAALDRLSVVFVVILAALFLHESFTLKHALGAVLVVAGAIFLTVK